MAETWYELIVEVTRQQVDVVANFLIEQGAPGVQLEDTGACTTVIAHFRREPPIDGLRRFCRDIGAAPDDMDIRIRLILDEQWAENWKLHFTPQLVGQHLCICPPWNVDPPVGRLAIVIEPGMAFGTGQHATTRGCLELLEHAIGTLNRVRVLDVGSGSGVLAIALAKLGATDVWAVDNDPSACVITMANAAANAVVVHVAATLDDVGRSFDLLTANLFTDLLTRLAPRFNDLLRPGGALIVSGLLMADELAVRAAYEMLGFTLVRRRQEDGWVSLLFQKELMR